MSQRSARIQIDGEQTDQRVGELLTQGGGSLCVGSLLAELNDAVDGLPPEVQGRSPWTVGSMMERIEDPDTALAEQADPEAAVLLQRISALQATVGIRPALFSAGVFRSKKLTPSAVPGAWLPVRAAHA